MQCCSTNDMTADHMTKASQGTKCKLMRCKIMKVAVNKSEAEKKGIENPKSVLKKKAARFKDATICDCHERTFCYVGISSAGP